MEYDSKELRDDGSIYLDTENQTLYTCFACLRLAC